MAALTIVIVSVATVFAASDTSRYLALVPTTGPVGDVWATGKYGCADGQSAWLISTLPKGETRAGTIRSDAFIAPETLSFYVAGHSHRNANFAKLYDQQTGKELRSAAAPGKDQAQRVEWNLAAIKGRLVNFQIDDQDTEAGYAWIAVGRFQPEVLPSPTGESLPGGWTATAASPQDVVESGIPFVKGNLWVSSVEGETLAIKAGGVKASGLYILGGANSVDFSNPGWGCGNSFECHFVGEEAGAIIINYAGGISDRIPMVWGYTLWWRIPYQAASEPFASDPAAQALLDRALCVANGKDGYRGYLAANYFFKIALRDLPVESLTLEDSAKKQGHPSVEGVTFLTSSGLENPSSALFKAVGGQTIPALVSDWLDGHTIDSRDSYPAKRRTAVHALAESISTFASDINNRTVSRAKPTWTADTFQGPRVQFSGSPLATILTNIYYENSHEMVTRVDGDGMVHESNKTADYFSGFGGWTESLGAFYSTSYTRIRLLTLLSNMGMSDSCDKSLGFFDKWIMYFPKAFPEIQMGGKPVPGHATVVANKPHMYYDDLRLSGWPTRYTTRDMGNPETDGHGMLMLSHYRSWAKQGRDPGWVNQRWDAIQEMAEFIPWAIENPDLSFSEHGLMYAESEGGMMNISFFANMPCYLGLVGYAEMAQAAGHTEKAARWSQWASRLRSAMDAYFPVKDSKWGDVWDASKCATWPPNHAILAAAFLGMDLYGYDPLPKLPEGWEERTRRSYKMQLAKLQPEFCSPAGLGYGQNAIAQSALLLDEMSDSAKLVEWLTRLCFSPRQPYPYRAPEGATVAGDGSVWRRWGDLGNLYQMAESVYTIHVMLGIDDVDEQELRLIPRLPAGWTGVSIEQWPVRAKSGGKTDLMSLGYTFTKSGTLGASMTVRIAKPVDRLRVRVGPFQRNVKAVSAVVNGRQTDAKLESRGDSQWVWVTCGNGKATKFIIDVKGACQ